MLDIIVKATSNSICNLFKDYFSILPVFSQDLNVDLEFQRTHELNQSQTIKFLNDDMDGRVLLLYNREPIDFSSIGKQVREKLWIQASDIKKVQIKEFVWAKIKINFKIVSNIREVIEIFELYNAIRLRRNIDIEIFFQFEDTLESVSFIYSTNFGNLTSFESYNLEKYGVLWTADVQAELDGPVISPESSYYPRILTIKKNFLILDYTNTLYSIDNYYKTSVDNYQLDNKGHVNKIIKTTIDDSLLIISRFKL